MLSSALINALAALAPAITHIDRIVRSTLSNYCDSQSFAYLGRQKLEESILMKIETGRFSSLLEVDDFIAYSVIIPNLSLETNVKMFIRKAFNVIRERDRISVQRDPRMFEFDCTRLYCRLRPRNDDAVDVAYSNDVIFEIQIRSAFEHAWASAVHSTVYKSDSVDLRRIRLSSQIKAQIEVLDSLLRRFDDEYRHVIVSPWSGLDEEIAVMDFLHECKKTGIIPSEIWPSNTRRLAENILNLPTKGTTRDMPKFLKDVKIQLEQMSRKSFPRSISVYQAFLVAVVNMQSLRPSERVVRHVTPELEALFPQVREVKERFSYDISAISRGPGPEG